MPRTVDAVIITALEEEREAVLRKLPRHRRVNPTNGDTQVYYGANVHIKLPRRPAEVYRVIVFSLVSMGRVQSATATNDAIRRWKPRYVLLVGIAGGVRATGVRLGDVLISDQVADYELAKITPTGSKIRWVVHHADTRLLNTARNLKASDWQSLISVPRPTKGTPQRHVGPMGTGDKVVAREEALTQLLETWPKLIGIEMEAGGVATATFNSSSKPGFFMVRAVSDLADEKKGSASVDKWRLYACDVAAAYGIALLRSCPFPAKEQGSARRRVGVSPSASPRKGTKLHLCRGDKGVPVSNQAKSFSQLDKDRFLSQSIKDIKGYFQREITKLKRSRKDVSVELTNISPRKFVAIVYLNGEVLNRCKVWLGDTFYAGSLCYAEGRHLSIDQDNTINSSFSIDSADNTLYLSTHTMSFSAPMPRPSGHLTAAEAAELLWQRFCQPLMREGDKMIRW